jgi:hypothetical protein
MVRPKALTRGKGIVFLHDFPRNAAEALPELLWQPKLAGY